jgi:hypothetical protein
MNINHGANLQTIYETALPISSKHLPNTPDATMLSKKSRNINNWR